MIIGLGHRRGVGKNTVGEILKQELEKDNLRVQLVSFASVLKDVAHQMYAWGGLRSADFYEKNYQLKEVVLPEIGKSPRTIWIEVGNKMRDIHPATWINNALYGANKFDVTIFTDARYPNELNAIQAVNGLVFKVYRVHAQKYNDIADSAAETWINWNGMICNDGTVEQLRLELKPFLIQIYQAIKVEHM